MKNKQQVQGLAGLAVSYRSISLDSGAECSLMRNRLTKKRCGKKVMHLASKLLEYQSFIAQYKSKIMF